MVKIENFSCGYNGKKVITNFAAICKSNQITVIVGKSGIGKSTLLKSINRLHESEDKGFFYTGNISVNIENKFLNINDIEVSTLRKKVGYIFQLPIPLPMSIEQNVAFGLKLSGISDKSKIVKALEQSYLWDEVKDRLNENATSLSLGQQQRLSIARVLALDPDFLLFDEPTSSLDFKATLEIEKLLISLKKNKTIILVSHDEEQVKRLSDNVINLN
jgi:phosphate transport system ATP-binding protein